MRRFLSSLLALLLLVQPAWAIRIPSGSTTHVKYFTLVDKTDHVTAETGRTASLTAYRARNGGTATAFTTPTFAEVDSTNMPGVYSLVIDEDTTITTANDTEEMVITIVDSGDEAAKESFVIELYDDTGSNVTSQPWNAAWDAEVESEANDALVDEHLDHLLAATYDVTSQPGSATSLLNRIVESDSGNPIFTTQVLQQAPVISQAAVRTAVGLASANLDSQLSAIVTDTAEVQTSLADGGFTDLLIDAILTDTAEIGSAGAGLTEAGGTGDQLTAVVWNAAWDAEVQSEVNDGLVAIYLDRLLAVDYDPASKPGTSTALLNEIVENDGGVSRFTVNALENGPSGSGASAETIADAVLDELLSGHTAAGSLGKAIADIETDATAILADSNELQTDWANGGRLDLLLDTAAAGGGASAASIADAVWDELQADHVVSGSFGELATEVVSILADTNELQTDWANGGRLDLILDTAAAGGGLTAGAIADAVLDEALASHTTAGTAGAILGEIDTAMDTAVFTSAAMANSGGTAITSGDISAIAAAVLAGQTFVPNPLQVWSLERTATGVSVQDSFVVTKGTTEKLNGYVYYGNLLGKGETISTIVSTSFTSSGSIAKTASSDAIVGDYVYAEFTGGAADDTGTYTVTARTTEGQEFVSTVTIQVK